MTDEAKPPAPPPPPAPPAAPPPAPQDDEHTRAQAQFSDFADGTLAAADRAALEQHLAGCAACKGELDAFQKTMAALRGHKADTPSPEFMTSLREQIRTRSRGRFFGDRRPTRWLEVASLVTLVIAAAIYVALKLAQPLLFLR